MQNQSRFFFSREYRSRFTSEKTLMFCMRVMVGVIILYDHVHPVGAFSKTSKIDVSVIYKEDFFLMLCTFAKYLSIDFFHRSLGFYTTHFQLFSNFVSDTGAHLSCIKQFCCFTSCSITVKLQCRHSGIN